MTVAINGSTKVIKIFDTSKPECQKDSPAPKFYSVKDPLRTLADSGHTILLSSHDTAQAIAAADTLLAISDGTLHGGQKADIIASGVLDATFRASGLRFDPVRGDFT